MKVFVAICAILAVSAFAVKVFDDDLINEVNRANVNWIAGHNRFSDWDIEDVKTILGAILPDTAPVKGMHEPRRIRVTSVPSSFDSRQKWGKCVHPIRDQAKCGSCWAFSASEVLSDHFCIQTNGSVDVVLSPQDLVSCDHTNMGCDGGQLPATWEYLVGTGIVSDTCMPYVSGGGDVPTCPTSCKDGSSWKKYHAASYEQVAGIWPFGRVEKIQKAIYESGPVQAAFQVYQDFMSYTTGVYKHTSGELLGGHAIKVIGWGNENGEDYWLVANSWGPTWGESGFFKILRGKDECGIESNVFTGPAKV